MLAIGTEFKGNVNNAVFKILTEEKDNFLILNIDSGNKFAYGKEALQHCNITIIKEPEK